MTLTNSGHIRRRRRAYTLAELIVSVAAMGILASAAGSALYVATRGMEVSAETAGDPIEVHHILGQITGDLRIATGYSEWTANAVSITVPDRNGDDIEEKIRYAWSGTAGDDLTYKYNDYAEIRLVGGVQDFAMDRLLRTLLPPPQACCLDDGSCQDLRSYECVDLGGVAWGPDTECATADCPPGVTVLMVVMDATSPDSEEVARQTLFESWSFGVELISDYASQSEFDLAFGNTNVAYVTQWADEGSLDTKLMNAPIGVVTEHRKIVDEIGLWEKDWRGSGGETAIIVDNNAHDILSPFALGSLTLADYDIDLLRYDGDPAPGTVVLSSRPGKPAEPTMAALETGATRYDGVPSTSRRVVLPWGQDRHVMLADLNANAQTILRRSLEWAAGSGTPSTKLLFVVTDAASPSSQEQDRQSLFQSWGYSVQMITAADPQADFDAAVATSDVAYICEKISSSDLDIKLRDAAIGVVIEEGQSKDEFGIADDVLYYTGRDTIYVIDNTHHITSSFSTGALQIFTTSMRIHMLMGNLAPGIQILSETEDGSSVRRPSLSVLETGASLQGGGTAAGRRVHMPWGGTDFDINNLNADGTTLLQKAIEWAAGNE